MRGWVVGYFALSWSMTSWAFTPGLIFGIEHRIRRHEVKFRIRESHQQEAFENNVDENFYPINNPDSQLYSMLESALKKALQRKQRQLTSLEAEWKKAQEAETLQHRADLILANLHVLTKPGVTRATLQDWSVDSDGQVGNFFEIELELDPQYDSPQDEAEAIYAQVRKRKRGTVVVRGLLDQAEKSLISIKKYLEELQELNSNLNMGRLEYLRDNIQREAKQLDISFQDFEYSQPKQSPNNNSKSHTKNTPKSQHTCRRLTTPDGNHIVLVGRNRHDNEYLSFHAARGNDVWMHARGCPGAHVLLQVRRGNPSPSEESLQFAANLAAFYSEAKSERKALVTAASPKHLLKPRGAPPGAVKLRQELPSLVGHPQNVPQHLLEMRDEEWDETGNRSLGTKAKNKKRTLAAIQQTQDSKRAERLLKQRAKRKRQSLRDDEGSETASF